MQMQDRSDSAELGTQVFFGDFRTFETLSIFKLEAGSDDSESPEQLLERVISEQRENASTFGFTLISVSYTHLTPPTTFTLYDLSVTVSLHLTLISSN